VRKRRDAQPLLAPEGDDEVGLLRAQVVYIGAQKCFVAMHSDIARGHHVPVLAYVAPQILERGSSGKIVVGDNVLVLPGAHAYKVTRALPRLNLFQRADPEGRPKPLASNLDQLVVSCIYIYTYVCMYVCIHMYACMYVCMYIYMHIYI
jgi:hypothetical protein